MKKNFLYYDEAYKAFNIDEIFYTVLIPKTVPFNNEIIHYNHYIYKVKIIQDRIIPCNNDVDIYDELTESLSNMYTAYFFEDKELAFYWKYRYTQEFITNWDNPEYDYSGVRDIIHSTINNDLLDKNINHETFLNFENNYPEKVLLTLSKLKIP